MNLRTGANRAMYLTTPIIEAGNLYHQQHPAAIDGCAGLNSTPGLLVSVGHQRLQTTCSEEV